ncbi:MAG: LrgB family protein [Clostridia bacterium]|nr:LrgB family protein [Clostridia bacterium]
MRAILTDSAYFGVVISLLAYYIGTVLKKKLKWALMNPLLISVILVIGALLLLGIDYEAYNASAKYITYFLTPATVCLAVPLYEQLTLLKKHFKAVMLGILSGVLASLGCILLLALLFHMDHAGYVTLLPKSITTAIGLGMSESMGGIPAITAAAIIITGILGNIIAEGFLKLLHVTEPVARGVAIGTASHAIGTSRAMELGEAEGAISSLSIAVAGLMTVVFVQLFGGLI